METDRKIKLILKIISESKEPIGSAEIAEKLKQMGVELSERTVRYHLKSLSEEGLLKNFWKEGRMITSKGKEELNCAMVSDKVGLVSARIEALAYQMEFDLEKRTGQVILNVSLFHQADFSKAVKIISQVFAKGLGMGDKVLVVKTGEEIGGMEVPTNKIGLGTLCTINLNGIFLKHSIPVESKFGGVIQIEDGLPLRFTELISYSGSTLDPHEIFIKSHMTSVRDAVDGSGKILAGLREIPAISKESAEKILHKIKEAGLGGDVQLGRSGSPILGMPVGLERVGLVVPGGLNPVAACEEWGLETESKALQGLVDYSRLIHYKDLK